MYSPTIFPLWHISYLRQQSTLAVELKNVNIRVLRIYKLCEPTSKLQDPALLKIKKEQMMY